MSPGPASHSSSRKRKSWDYIKRYFPKYRSKNSHFQSLIEPYLHAETILLDLGCGRGLETARDYKSFCKKSYGVDLDDAVFENETIHEPLQGSAYEIPLDDAGIDLVVSQQVFEHLEFPDRMFREVSRVLKPGGIFAAMTPNLWYPTTIVSSVTPHSFHVWATKNLLDIKESDTFPTFYRANRLSTLKQLGASHGLHLEYWEYYMCNPGQFAFSPFLTRFEVAYIRTLCAFDYLAKLRDIVIVIYKKI